jgi:hypothetical protein
MSWWFAVSSAHAPLPVPHSEVASNGRSDPSIAVQNLSLLPGHSRSLEYNVLGALFHTSTLHRPTIKNLLVPHVSQEHVRMVHANAPTARRPGRLSPRAK